MRACPSCAESIQDAAVKCRFCGSEVPTRRERPSYWTPGRVLLGLIGVPGAFLVALLFGGIVFSAAGVGTEFNVVGTNAEDCSSLGDFCVRVTCTVTNAGTRAGSAQVELRVDQGAGLVDTEAAFLEAGESATVSHDFTSAEFTFDNIPYDCSAR